MKKISIISGCVLLVMNAAYAGGDIEPIVEPVIVVEDVVTNESGLYIGVGISALKLKDHFTDEEFTANGVMLQAGYQYNKYLAIEGRYSFHVGDVAYDKGKLKGVNYDDYPTDFTNLGIYIKPMYSVDNFSAYALLGYGEVELTNIPQDDADRTEAGFQWGLGLGYDFHENVSIFVDYVRMYDDDGFDGRATNRNVVADAWTLGVTYKF